MEIQNDIISIQRIKKVALLSVLMVLLSLITQAHDASVAQPGMPLFSMTDPCVNNDITLSRVPGNTVRITWKRDGVVVGTEEMPAWINTIAGGEETRKATGFSFPSGIAIDKHGNIYVADQFNHRVQRWTPGATTGVTVAGGNGEGSSPAHLYYPLGVTIDEAGDLYIADAGNNRIQRWTPGANQGVTVAGGHGKGSGDHQLSVPHGVAVNAQGDVYVADNYNHRIQYWPKGATKGITVAGGNGAGNNLDQLVFPTNIRITKNGDLYIADSGNDRIVKADATTKRTSIVAGGNGRGSKADQFYYPTDMSVTETGDVYVSDHVNNRIQLWKDGATTGITVAGGHGLGQRMEQFYFPYAVVTGPNEELYVVDQYNHRVQHYRNLEVPMARTFSFRAIEAGKYTAVLTNREGKEHTTQEIVVNAAVKVSPFEWSNTVCEGDHQILHNSVPGTWQTSNSDIASINNNNELITHKAGTVTIQYLPTDNTGCVEGREEVLMVKPLPTLPVVGMGESTIGNRELQQTEKDAPVALIVCAGSSIPFSTIGGEWISNDPSVAQVQEKEIMGLKEGVAQIKYTIEQDGCSAALLTQVTVFPQPVKPRVEGINRVVSGAVIQLHAQGLSGNWYSLNEEVAQVDARGQVKGMEAGNTRIAFRYANQQGCTADTSVVMMVHPKAPQVKDSVYRLSAQTQQVHVAAQVTGTAGMELLWFRSGVGNTPAVQPVLPNEPGTYVFWASQVQNGIPSVKVPYRVTIVRSEATAGQLEIDVMGNPVTQYFTVRIKSQKAAQPVNIRVFDLQGRILEQRNGIAAGTTVQFGQQYAGGQYILECVQGTERKVVQLLKTGMGRGNTIATQTATFAKFSQ